MDDAKVTDSYGDSLSVAKVIDSPLVAVWFEYDEGKMFTFHFTEDQGLDLINEIAEVIMEIRRDG